MITLPADDPLAQRPALHLGELSGLPLVLLADADSQGFNAVALAVCRAGLDPDVVWIPRGEAGDAFRRAGGFTFVTGWARGNEAAGVVIVATEGPGPTLFYDLTWRSFAPPCRTSWAPLATSGPRG